jgi:hypothetical protein
MHTEQSKNRRRTSGNHQVRTAGKFWTRTSNTCQQFIHEVLNTSNRWKRLLPNTYSNTRQVISYNTHCSCTGLFQSNDTVLYRSQNGRIWTAKYCENINSIRFSSGEPVVWTHTFSLDSPCIVYEMVCRFYEPVLIQAALRLRLPRKSSLDWRSKWTLLSGFPRITKCMILLLRENMSTWTWAHH